MKAIGYFLVVALLIWLAATNLWDFLGIKITGENPYVSALIFAVILSLVNLIIASVFRFITLPFNIITFGLVGFLISLLMIYFADSFYDNIAIEGFLGYMCISFIPGVASMLVGKKSK